MKKKTHLLSLLLLFILSNISFAQNELKHPHPIAKEDGFSYRSLMKLLDMDSLYIGSKYENSYHDMLSVLYSRVGRYKEAMRHAEKGYLFRNTMSSAKYYKNVIPVPLSGLMDSIIENNRVIMFNEMHFNPRHRAFVVSWLKKCYDNGYRYLAAETISAKDTLLNERRTVLLGTSGFYSDEPVFGDFLRTAQNIGYDLVPYERTDMNKEREKAQAENLIKNILEILYQKVYNIGNYAGGAVWEKKYRLRNFQTSCRSLPLISWVFRAVLPRRLMNIYLICAPFSAG